MLIRCERCSTLYELDEALLAPGGSQVQCTKCQHVFTAFPAERREAEDGGTPASASAAAAPEPEAPPPQPEEPPAWEPAEPRPEGPRAPRSGPPPVYRPPTTAFGGPSAAGMGGAPVLRRNPMGSYEARLRWSARWRWLAPALAAVALAAAGAGWYLLSRRAGPDPAARAEVLALVARDDAASLEKAIALLDEDVRDPAARRTAAVDRALAEVLRAAAAVEEGEALGAERAELLGEQERLRQEQPEGWTDAERAAGDGARALEGRIQTLEEQARRLGARALEALRVLQSEIGEAPEVARGLAAYHVLGGDRGRAERALRSARGGAEADPWLDLVEGWLEAGAAEPAGRERAVEVLQRLAEAHPELLRGRYLLARVQASLGRRSEALATLERLLADNPRHQGAARLRRDLASPREEAAVAPEPPLEAPSAAPPPPAPATPEPRPARNEPAAPRKIVARPQPGPLPASAPPIAAEPPPPEELAPPPAPAEGSDAPAPVAVPDPGGAVEAPAVPPPAPRRAPRAQPSPEPPGDGG